MATTITTDNVKTIYALDAVTSLADTDDLIVWDSTNSAHKKITRADLQTDIASRSEDNLATLAAITTAGTVLPDGKAVGELVNKDSRITIVTKVVSVSAGNTMVSLEGIYEGISGVIGAMYLGSWWNNDFNSCVSITFLSSEVTYIPSNARIVSTQADTVALAIAVLWG